MSDPHLRHVLPWHELLNAFKQGDGSEIVLPSGAVHGEHVRC